MTDKHPRPAEPSEEARELLAEAAEDYAANKENRRRAQANAAADEQANARADAADNGGTW